MNNLNIVILTFIGGIIFGFWAGSTYLKGVVNSDCKKYGSYVTSEYKMTCEAIK